MVAKTEYQRFHLDLLADLIDRTDRDDRHPVVGRRGCCVGGRVLYAGTQVASLAYGLALEADPVRYSSRPGWLARVFGSWARPLVHLIEDEFYGFDWFDREWLFRLECQWREGRRDPSSGRSAIAAALRLMREPVGLDFQSTPAERLDMLARYIEAGSPVVVDWPLSRAARMMAVCRYGAEPCHVSLAMVEPVFGVTPEELDALGRAWGQRDERQSRRSLAAVLRRRAAELTACAVPPVSRSSPPGAVTTVLSPWACSVPVASFAL